MAFPHNVDDRECHMKLDLVTLTVILSLIFLAQVIAVSVQYRVNRLYRGVGWWLLGSILMATACFLMPLVRVPALQFLARIANPLLLLGQVVLYLGVMRFLGRRENRAVLILSYGLFLVGYYYYMYPVPSLSGRIVVFSLETAIISGLTAYSLFTGCAEAFRSSARFTAIVFLVHGGFDFIRIFPTMLNPLPQSYTNLPPIQVAAYVLPILTTTLWTFGFILMVNQRLHAEVSEEKEVLMVAEAALRESEATYRSILDASPDDITITDLEGRILLVSPAAHAMFGFQVGEEHGKRLLDFLVPGEVERARANLGLLFQSGRQGTHEYRALKKDGSTFAVEVNSDLIRGPQGKPVRMVFIIRDITARMRTEAEKADLEVRNRQLEKAESLARMAGAIAHHFNNQLQTVMMSLEQLRGPMRGTDAERFLVLAEQASDRAAEVSRLMLTYLGQTSQPSRPLLLAESCRSVLGSLGNALPAGLRLEVDLPAPGPVVCVEDQQIRQILANLITNAREAMGPEAGAIQVGLEVVPAARVPNAQVFPVAWRPLDQEYACLTVADPGCGIPDTDLDKLFDPFFSTKFTGRGLGLSVVLGLAQAHGGAVQVESTQGQGSVFRVYLPVSSGPIPSLAEAMV